MQSSCRFNGGTSRPSSIAAAHGSDNTLSTICAIACVRTSTDHERFVTVSYSIMFPKWQLPSTTCMHQRVSDTNIDDDIPALHSISSQRAARKHTIARTHCYRIRRVPHVCDVVRRRLEMSQQYNSTHLKMDVMHTGDGRCRRCAAIRSPGGSNVTTGTPNVIPRRDASEPPRECPMSHIFALGNIKVMLL